MGTPGVIVRGLTGLKRRAGGINRFNAAGDSCCCGGGGGCGPYLGIAPSSGSCFDPTKQRVASLIWSVQASYSVTDRQTAFSPPERTIENASLDFQVEVVFGIGTPAPWALVSASGTFSASRTSTDPGQQGANYVGSLSRTYGNLAAYLAEDSRGRGIAYSGMAAGMQFAGPSARNSSGLVSTWRFGSDPTQPIGATTNSDQAIRAVLFGSGLAQGATFQRTTTGFGGFPNLNGGDSWYGRSHVTPGGGDVFQTGTTALPCGTSGSIDSSSSGIELVLDYTQTYTGMGSFSLFAVERRVFLANPLIRRDASLTVDQSIMWQPCT